MGSNPGTDKAYFLTKSLFKCICKIILYWNIYIACKYCKDVAILISSRANMEDVLLIHLKIFLTLRINLKRLNQDVIRASATLPGKKTFKRSE